MTDTFTRYRVASLAFTEAAHATGNLSVGTLDGALMGVLTDSVGESFRDPLSDDSLLHWRASCVQKLLILDGRVAHAAGLGGQGPDDIFRRFLGLHLRPLELTVDGQPVRAVAAAFGELEIAFAQDARLNPFLLFRTARGSDEWPTLTRQRLPSV